LCIRSVYEAGVAFNGPNIAVLLHRCAVVMITIVFFDTMSDFAKFVTQKEVVYVLNLITHMAAIECKVAMCIISRLVEFELLLELKFEQKGYFTAYLVL
jgi:hypothetical protein